MLTAEVMAMDGLKEAPVVDESIYDVVVVGGGAAGLNAALVLGRARRRVAVIDAGEPRNAPAAHMQGFLSRDGMSPAALLEVGRAEVAGYGVDLIDARVEHIGPGFSVRLEGGAAVAARRVLVASGLRDELPDLPGVAARWGRDVLHCPYCHGYEVRDRPLGVVATGPGAVHQALLLPEWSQDVVFFTHEAHGARGFAVGEDERRQLTARGVRIVEGAVKQLVLAGDQLVGVELAEGQVVRREAVFVQSRMVPRDTLLIALGCAVDDDGWVITDGAGRTSVHGVWAVGNVADRKAQVVTAAGMGSAAAIAVHQDLVAEDTQRAVESLRAGTAVPAV
ncbi:NAD(P)/FAD-dependent oxidoreductase [Streptomyces sp. NBC_00690]|uniref:NAD(P)/FAD-dependent oxidoreductase n=1 Tax=Streptomyces sp. NBC_00690 TaxID=2975808 RepID=UPI002E2A90D8|nr:NAD(P)/FAD-dependent oxidoreductase [Streptomyces sp. NBC_00690]